MDTSTFFGCSLFFEGWHLGVDMLHNGKGAYCTCSIVSEYSQWQEADLSIKTWLNAVVEHRISINWPQSHSSLTSSSSCIAMTAEICLVVCETVPNATQHGKPELGSSPGNHSRREKHGLPLPAWNENMNLSLEVPEDTHALRRSGYGGGENTHLTFFIDCWSLFVSFAALSLIYVDVIKVKNVPLDCHVWASIWYLNLEQLIWDNIFRHTRRSQSNIGT